ncbi:hypothetical protein A306_00011726, partial [Columba livia]
VFLPARRSCGARGRRHVPHRGPGPQAGPRGAAAEDAARRAHLRAQLPHLRRAAADHSFHPEEAGQYMNTEEDSVCENMKWTVAAFPCLLIKCCARGRQPVPNGS